MSDFANHGCDLGREIRIICAWSTSCSCFPFLDKSWWLLSLVSSPLIETQHTSWCSHEISFGRAGIWVDRNQTAWRLGLGFPLFWSRRDLQQDSNTRLKDSWGDQRQFIIPLWVDQSDKTWTPPKIFTRRHRWPKVVKCPISGDTSSMPVSLA